MNHNYFQPMTKSINYFHVVIPKIYEGGINVFMILVNVP